MLNCELSEIPTGRGSYAVILLVSLLGSLKIVQFNGVSVHCFVVAHFSALYVYYFQISCPVDNLDSLHMVSKYQL